MQLQFGVNLLKIAEELEDSILHSHLGTGDLVASDGNYHPSCYWRYRSKYRSFFRNKLSKQAKEEQMLDERAFLELIESIKSDAESGVRMFPMAELNKLYSTGKEEQSLVWIHLLQTPPD